MENRIITRREFFETLNIDPKLAFSRLYGNVGTYHNQFEEFLSGDITDTIQVPCHCVLGRQLINPDENVPFWLRIGAESTTVAARHTIPVDASIVDMKLNEVIDRYVIKFNEENFAQDYGLTEADKELIRTKHCGVRVAIDDFIHGRMKKDKILVFSIPNNGPKNILLELMAKPLISYSFGIMKDEGGAVLGEDGRTMMFFEHNVLDVIYNEENRGGR